jgi:hypothetical protein
MRYRLPSPFLTAIKQKLESRAPLPSYATTIYSVVSYTPFINAEQAAANAFQNYGHALLAKG